MRPANPLTLGLVSLALLAAAASLAAQAPSGAMTVTIGPLNGPATTTIVVSPPAPSCPVQMHALQGVGGGLLAARNGPAPRFPRHAALWARVEPALPPGELAHDRHHIERVYRWSLRLAGEAGADADLSGAAALVHDLALVPKDSPERALGGERSASSPAPRWSRPATLATRARRYAPPCAPRRGRAACRRRGRSGWCSRTPTASTPSAPSG